jgi:capsular polysaccharide biosynthesis protein
LQTTLHGIDINVEATADKLANLKNRLDIVQKRIDNTPKIEKAYISLTREYEHLKAIHSQHLTEMANVKAAQEVKELKKGDRFTIVDAASFPQKPSKPDVLVIIIVGSIISLSLSFGILFLADNADMSIRTDSELSGATGFPVLVSVPYIKNAFDKMKIFFSIVFQLIIALIFIVGAVWTTNYYYLNYALPRLP